LVIGAQAELEIDNASGVELQQKLGVNGRLRITRGLLQTQTYLVTMGATATLSESETARVIGQIRATRTLSQGVSHDFGGLGLENPGQTLHRAARPSPGLPDLLPAGPFRSNVISPSSLPMTPLSTHA